MFFNRQANKTPWRMLWLQRKRLLTLHLANPNEQRQASLHCHADKNAPYQEWESALVALNIHKICRSKLLDCITYSLPVSLSLTAKPPTLL